MKTYIYINFNELTLTEVNVFTRGMNTTSNEKIHSLKPDRFFITAYAKMQRILSTSKNIERITIEN